jgi:hypothetical protein
VGRCVGYGCGSSSPVVAADCVLSLSLWVTLNRGCFHLMLHVAICLGLISVAAAVGWGGKGGCWLPREVCEGLEGC